MTASSFGMFCAQLCLNKVLMIILINIVAEICVKKYNLLNYRESKKGKISAEFNQLPVSLDIINDVET